MATAISKVKPAIPTLYHMIYGTNHLAFADTITQYIEKEINPHVDEWERNKAFPARQVFRKLGKLGVFGVNKPIEYGGLGLDFSYSVLVAETMGKINCGALPMAVAVQSDMSTPALSEFGSDYLKKEFLLPSMLGERISCLGISEPYAGSDVKAIRTTARWHGDDLIINGAKQWITNGHQADWICLLANTNQNQCSHRNKSLICVNMNEPGVKLGRRIEKLGMHSSDTAEIFFDDVRVPSRNIIGDEGRGFIYQMFTFDIERLVAVAVLLEPLSRVLQSTIEYTQDRHIFGEPVLNNQSVIYRLAELTTELESVRSLLYRAVLEKLAGNNVTPLASMAKLKASRLARIITDNCLQYWGGNGYTWDNLVTRFYRDLRVFSIAAGADEVMLSIISKHLLDSQKFNKKKKTITYHDQVMRSLISRASTLFEVIDADNNGFLDRKEMMVLIDKSLNGICVWNAEQAMRFRWAMDKNVDGMVDLTEFLTFEHWVHKIINMRNMGKSISIRRLIRRGDGFSRPYFAELDINNDGFIDEMEINTERFRYQSNKSLQNINNLNQL